MPYKIVVRGRPVQGPVGVFATHTFLAIVDEVGKVIDSLSFDPSNSIGSADADPYNLSRGGIVVQRNATQKQWDQLKECYKMFARISYKLAGHNCCDAVKKALVSTNLEFASRGIAFASKANATWDKCNCVLGSEDYEKKNV